MAIETNRQHNVHKTQHNIRWTPLYVNKHKKTQITQIRHAPSYKKLEVNMNEHRKGLYIVFCPFDLFLLAIVWSVLF